MVKFIDSRDSGKTRKLLSSCCEDPKALFVCAHPYRVLDKCRAYGIPCVEAIGYDEYIKALEKKDSILDNRNIYIDEIEKFVCTFSKLHGYSLSLD